MIHRVAVVVEASRRHRLIGRLNTVERIRCRTRKRGPRQAKLVDPVFGVTSMETTSWRDLRTGKLIPLGKLRLVLVDLPRGFVLVVRGEGDGPSRLASFSSSSVLCMCRSRWPYGGPLGGSALVPQPLRASRPGITAVVFWRNRHALEGPSPLSVSACSWTSSLRSSDAQSGARLERPGLARFRACDGYRSQAGDHDVIAASKDRGARRPEAGCPR